MATMDHTLRNELESLRSTVREQNTHIREQDAKLDRLIQDMARLTDLVSVLRPTPAPAVAQSSTTVAPSPPHTPPRTPLSTRRYLSSPDIEASPELTVSVHPAVTPCEAPPSPGNPVNPYVQIELDRQRQRSPPPAPINPHPPHPPQIKTFQPPQPPQPFGPLSPTQKAAQRNLIPLEMTPDEQLRFNRAQEESTSSSKWNKDIKSLRTTIDQFTTTTSNAVGGMANMLGTPSSSSSSQLLNASSGLPPEKSLEELLAPPPLLTPETFAAKQAQEAAVPLQDGTKLISTLNEKEAVFPPPPPPVFNTDPTGADFTIPPPLWPSRLDTAEPPPAPSYGWHQYDCLPELEKTTNNSTMRTQWLDKMWRDIVDSDPLSTPPPTALVGNSGAPQPPSSTSSISTPTPMVLPEAPRSSQPSPSPVEALHRKISASPAGFFSPSGQPWS
eukprot:TRINITY_DN47868_c0_g1_i1.p1 TRINITY_DN47868_c0_g1~~TRINITY_DN47868_c0_g1_i1.p1  ORF type:complete len:443 (-),score=52.56 TRINITY_DN47868_c0_g1_i1:1131-2459(-)